jgi:hypothetical protein
VVTKLILEPGQELWKFRISSNLRRHISLFLYFIFEDHTGRARKYDSAQFDLRIRFGEAQDRAAGPISMSSQWAPKQSRRFTSAGCRKH